MTQSPLVWQDGAPRSSLFGDIYYSLEDGLAESRAVFLAGCGLPDAWRGRRQYVVGELGFGTGLNIAALLHLWTAHRPPGGRLQVFSIEAFPPSREDAARALSAWPELADQARALLEHWPTGRKGLHRIDLPQWNAVVDVVVMPVNEALDQWSGRADAWFLDGFSPALNPQMWTPQVLRAVGERSASGARAATFTVAGAVRRGLEAAGFTVEKRPGHGRKRERLEAKRDCQRSEPDLPQVAIIGAGIAGAALARALRAQGVEPLVLSDPAGVAASANPSALVAPTLDAGGGKRAQLYADAFHRAVTLYGDVAEAVLARGVLQAARDPRDPARFAAIIGQDHFRPGSLNLTDGGLDFEDALVVRPHVVLPAWTGPMAAARVEGLKRAAEKWVLLTDQGEFEVDEVILAAGYGNAALAPGIDLMPVRGQVSWAPGAPAVPATSFGGYAAPMDDGVLFGATHDRGDPATDLRQGDHDRNLALLAEGLPELAAALAGVALEGRASIRAATRDYMPVAGRIEPGLWILGGLGSRGFTTAPLLAEHLAATLLDRPSSLLTGLAPLISPARAAARPPAS